MNRRKAQTPAKKSTTNAVSVVIPERNDILQHLENAASPMNLREIAAGLKLTDKAQVVALRRRLKAMTRDGQLLHTRGNRFGVATKMELIAGEVLGHADGFAFVRPEDGGDDIYLSHREARGALHGDRVLVRLAGYDQRKRPYGNLVEVLERANEEVVGRYFREGGVGIVTPDNRRISHDLLISGGAKGAKNGQFVVAKITQQPDRRRQPIGEIVEVLGDHMSPGMEIDVAIRAWGLPDRWPEAVEREVAQIPDRVLPAMCEGRTDLRQLPFVTIDGADARDFDDAVYCTRTRSGYRLYVAIADVAHYVTPGSALDQEAYARGTSVYFPNNVIPMLPEALSNGICSLMPDVDRLAVVCDMRIDDSGELTKYRFYDAVINSKARLTYDEVAGWLAGPAARKDDAVRYHVGILYELYGVLLRQRQARGALDFESQEPYFIFNDQRKIERIEVRQRNDAHRLIEEAMIAANVTAATDLLKHGRSALFRNHDRPDPEKIAALREFLQGVGLSLGGGDEPDARDLATTLAAAADRPDRRLIETVLLRGQKLAEYQAVCSGHFGLALPAYAHFTSPIRRYPDLLVHRAIKSRVARRRQSAETVAAMPALGQHCSMTERRADEATRDAVAWLKCEYMEDKVGQTFDGTISSVTSFGLFVELDDVFVEGLVHVTGLPRDYYEFDPVRHTLRGRASGRRFTVAGRIRVSVARVSLDDRKIDFTLVEERAKKSKSRRRR